MRLKPLAGGLLGALLGSFAWASGLTGGPATADISPQSEQSHSVMWIGDQALNGGAGGYRPATASDLGAANTGITPVTTTGTALTAKTSAGSLYGYDLQEGATAGYFAFLNLTAAPAASAAITPINCVYVAANGHVAIRQNIPDAYSTGIVVVSSSSCTTYTAVASTFIGAEVK